MTTTEQKSILSALAERKSIAVTARAGCGKTSTALLIAGAMDATGKILMLTYNKRLRDETAVRIAEKKIANMDVFTFHGHASRLFGKICNNDIELRSAMKSKIDVARQNFDILIIDEAQDLNEDYYNYAQFLIKNNTIEELIVLFGDDRQNIYSDLNRTDCKYLLSPEKYFPKHTWVRRTLTVSFRLTNSVAELVCKAMNSGQTDTPFKITAAKKSKNKPLYFIMENDFQPQKLARYLHGLIQRGGFSPDDVFVLAPSVRRSATGGEKPVAKLERTLVRYGYPCHTPTSDDAPLTDNIMKNKIVFSTFHQAKGLERKIVIIYSFDESYFIYNNKTANHQDCTNQLYVAMTRCSTDHLILVSSAKYSCFPFIDFGYVGVAGDLVAQRLLKSCKSVEQNTISVVDLCRYAPTALIEKYRDLFDENTQPNFLKKIPGKYAVPIPSQITIDGQFVVSEDLEPGAANTRVYDVSDVNGSVLPYWFENNNMIKLPYAIKMYLNSEEYKTRYTDISSYDWLNDYGEVLLGIYRESTASGLSRTPQILIEQRVFSLDTYPAIHGRLDGVDVNNNQLVWEFKCVERLDHRHLLQLMIYAWMHRKTNTSFAREYRLLNIRTGEMWMFKYTNRIGELISELCAAKNICIIDEKKEETKSEIPSFSDDSKTCISDEKKRDFSSETKVSVNADDDLFASLNDAMHTLSYSTSSSSSSTVYASSSSTVYASSSSSVYASSSSSFMNSVAALASTAKPVDVLHDDVALALAIEQSLVDVKSAFVETKNTTIGHDLSILSGKKVLVIDTETSSHNTKIDKVLSIGWWFTENYDAKTIDPTKTNGCLVQHQSVRIHPEAFKIHHITEKMVRERGIPMATIMGDAFGDALLACDYVVGYNAFFDVDMLYHELLRSNLASFAKHLLKLLQTSRCVDAMKYFHGKVPSFNKAGGSKQPKLCEVYRHYYKKDAADQHDAVGDVKTLLECLKGVSA